MQQLVLKSARGGRQEGALVWAAGTFLQYGAPWQHQPRARATRGLLQLLATVWELEEQRTCSPALSGVTAGGKM